MIYSYITYIYIWTIYLFMDYIYIYVWTIWGVPTWVRLVGSIQKPWSHLLGGAVQKGSMAGISSNGLGVHLDSQRLVILGL